MPTQDQILDFWGNARQAGYSDEEIRGYAMQRGWVREKAPVLAQIDRRQELGLPVAITPSDEDKSYGERLLDTFIGGATQMRGAYRSILGTIAREGAGLSPVPGAAEDVGIDLQRKATEDQFKGSELRGESLAPDVDTFFRRSGLQFAGAAGEMADILVPFEYAPRLASAGLSKVGSKMLFKGLDDDIARGITEGLRESILDESMRLSEAIQVERVVALEKKMGEGQALDIAKEVMASGKEAVDAATVAHTSRVSRLTEDYHRNLERLEEMFPPDVGRGRLNQIVAPTDEASFLDVGTQITDEPRLIGPDATRVDPGPNALIREGVPNVQTRLEVIPPGPINNRLAIAAEAMERGYVRSLAESQLAYEAVQDVVNKNVSARLGRLKPGQWAEEIEKRARAQEVQIRKLLAEKGHTATLYEKAGEALDRAYASALSGQKNNVATRQFLGRAAQEKARQAYLLADVAPAEMYDDRISSGFWRWMAERGRRLVDPFRGGNAAGFQEGLAFSTARRYKDRGVQKWVREYIPKRAEETSGNIALLNFKREQIRRNVSAAISRYSRRSGRSVEEVGELLATARREGSGNLVPDSELRNALKQAGDFVDELSQRYLDEGLVTEGGLQSFKDNLGKYLHTSYASMHVKDWAKHVKETARWESAYRWFRENWPDMAEEEIMGTMLRLVERPKDIIRGRSGLDAIRGDLPKPLFDELKHKTDLPEELRELFGVSKDFILDFDASAAKMIYSLEWSAFQRDILVQGLRNGTISKNAPKAASIAGGNVRRIPLGQISEDAHYYVSDELGGLLGVVDEVSKRNQQFILPLLNGIAKMNKTVFSTSAQTRNAWSWPFMWLQAGVLGARHPVRSARAWKLAGKVFRSKVTGGGKFTAEELALVNRAHELNLIETGVASGTQDIWLEQASRAWQGSPDRLSKAAKTARGLTGPRVVATGRGIKRVLQIDKLLKAYRGTDSVGKFVGWMVKREQLDALVKTPDDIAYLAKRYGSTDIDEAAANFAKDTLQHFPRTPTIGKKLARNPAVGTFVSFQLEMIRNLSNTMKYLGSDLAHARALAAQGDKAGAARWTGHALTAFAGLVSSQLAWKAAQAHFNGVHGIDKRTEEAIRRRIMGPWSENNDYVVSDRTSDEITVTDMGYSNPYSVASSMVNAAIIRPGDLSERLLRVGEELEDVFLGREIFASAVLGAAQNRTVPDSGILTSIAKGEKQGQIARETDPDQLWERAYWFLQRTMPDAMVRSDRVFEAATDERAFGSLQKKERAMDYEVWQEVAALFGMPRVAHYDTRKSLGYHYREAKRLKNDLSATFKTRYRSNPTSETVAKYTKTWDAMQEDLHLLIDDSYALGLTPKDVQQLLGDAGFSRVQAKRFTRGENMEFLDVFEFPEDR